MKEIPFVESKWPVLTNARRKLWRLGRHIRPIDDGKIISAVVARLREKERGGKMQ